MSGESQLAKKVVADALKAAAEDKTQAKEPMLFALLEAALSELRQTRSRPDIESYISFHLDNMSESEWVITRGC